MSVILGRIIARSFLRRRESSGIPRPPGLRAGGAGSPPSPARTVCG